MTTFVCLNCAKTTVLEKGGDGRRCPACEVASRERLWDSICPPLYRTTELEKLPNLKATTEALGWNYGQQGLLLYGATGHGKTRTLYLLLKRLILSEGYRPEIFDCVTFGHKIATLFQEPDNAVEWLERLSKTKLVVFDDLGKVKLTERAETELFGVIEHRTANMLPMIITTQDSKDSLTDRIKDPLRADAMIRRLREFCKVVTF